MALMSGVVYIVGAGPGDPELLTVKAARLLSEADVILYDRLAPPGALSYARRDSRLVDVGKAPGGKGWTQDEINSEMARWAAAGMKVVRLKGGDPLVFGRGEEECSYLLARNIRCEIVPGVSSATGVPSCAGIPLASRWGSSTFAVATGRTAQGPPARALGEIAKRVDTLVVMMPLSNLRSIADELATAVGPGTPAALVRNGCIGSQSVIEATISEMPSRAAGLLSPAILVVGAGAALRKRLTSPARAP
ncbi:MAG: uroporphyrinogen-III C-methyltransferase [Conexivisphaera sp.]|jgi:uroporphyrin-III C-methyltransferase